MFDKVLIANRGEIAVRINRACQELGISTVAIHSEADAESMHVRIADESVCIGPNAVNKSYLNTHSIIAACEITGAQAVHPGYGFLSENASFSKMLEDHKLIFIGPNHSHINAMGDKIQAKKMMKEFGVPTVPGSDKAIENEKDAINISKDIGYPVLIKASAGGGGRGMKVVNDEKELRQSLPIIKQEALSFFGNDSVYIEKFIDSPRHIEVQVICDSHGNFLHLHERDCSVQRRNQKVLEEALAPGIENEKKDELFQICVGAMKKMQYLGLGTLEFLYENGEFYFMEMNTRLQVEHPITEMLTRIDLVREQICVAHGEKIFTNQENIKPLGHSIECRINAEHPETFIPSPGKISQYHQPGGLGVRVDSAVYQGYSIPPHYDSMISKLITYGDSRNDCIQKMKRALEEYVIIGIDTNIQLHQKIIQSNEFISGNYNINYMSKFDL